MCRCRSVTGRRAFPRDAFPGRSGHTVLPGISSGGGSILSSGLPFFFFSGACRRGRHRVGSGLPVPGQRKSGSTLAVPRTLYCSRNIPRKPAKAPELSGIAERLIPAALSAPLAYRTAVLFAPWIPVPVRRTTALAGTFSSVFSSVVQKALHKICVPVPVRYVPAGLSVPAGCS